MVRGSNTMGLVARYAPLAFGFCFCLGLLGPAGLARMRQPVKTCKAWRVRTPGVLAATVRLDPAPKAVPSVRGADQPLPVRLALPPGLQAPISGPALFVGSGQWKGPSAKRSGSGKTPAKAAPSKPQSIARLRLARAGKRASRLEYRVGQPLRPETVRLPDRAQLRVMVPANAASIRRLKNYARSRKGFSVQVKPLGSSKLALHLSCDAHCELGTVQPFAKGFAVDIKHVDDPSLSLR